MDTGDSSRIFVMLMVFGIPLVYALWMGSMHRKAPKMLSKTGVTDKYRE